MFEKIKYFFFNNKKPILIGAAVLLIIVIAVLSIPKKELPAPVQETKVPGQDIVAAIPSIKQVELTEEDKARRSIEIAGKNFAEFYGSYSNQSDYSNLESVLPLLTQEYRAQILQILNKYRETYKPSAAYEGVTTVAMSLPVLEALNITAGTATIKISTQRKFSVGTQANYSLKNQDIRLNLIKENNVWLIDGAKWL